MLSDNAKKRRKQDMLNIAASAPPEIQIRIAVIGVLYWLLFMAGKLSNKQRASLIILSTTAAGIVIVLLIKSGQIGLALAVMFVLGLLVNEISHL